MFLHVSVILFTGGCLLPGGVSTQGGLVPGECLVLGGSGSGGWSGPGGGGACSRGVACSGGACSQGVENPPKKWLLLWMVCILLEMHSCVTGIFCCHIVKPLMPILALLPVSLNYEKPRFRLQSQTTLKWKKQYSFTFVPPKADPELCKATQHQLGVVNPFITETPYTPTKLKLFPISRNCFFKLIKNLKCSISLCMLASPLPCALDLVNVH